MPNYDYKCVYCDNIFEKQRMIKDRNAAIDCPKCFIYGTSHLTFRNAPIIGDPVRLGVTRPSSDVLDKLKDIKKKVHGSDMPSRYI
jgi:putative FmdB family regulatory protein